MVDYAYDDAGRLETIWHSMGDSVGWIQTDYQWSPDGLVTQITETDDASNESTTTFTYDRRNRVVEEERTGLGAYHLKYEYDKAGNRLKKTDVTQGQVTFYTYDVSDPETYRSQGNRLMYEKTQTTDDPPLVLRERWYNYDNRGWVRHVTERLEGDNQGECPADTDPQWFSGTSIWYTTGGQVWMARKEHWRFYNAGQYEGHMNGATQEYLSAMEYRYDGPTERYMARGRNPDLSIPPRVDGTPAFEAGSWHDYDGGIFADWTVDITTNGQGDVTDLAAHERTAHVQGLAQYDYNAGSGQEQHYLHGNLIGTTVAVSDSGAGNGGHGPSNAWHPRVGILWLFA